MVVMMMMRQHRRGSTAGNITAAASSLITPLTTSHKPRRSLTETDRLILHVCCTSDQNKHSQTTGGTFQPQHTITIIHLVYSEILYLYTGGADRVTVRRAAEWAWPLDCAWPLDWAFGVKGRSPMSPLRRREGPSSQLTDEVGGASFSSHLSRSQI